MTVQKDAIQKDKDLNISPAPVVDDKSKTGTEGDDAVEKGLDGELKPLLEGGDDEEVTIKRGSLKKLHGAKENYKTVALSKKGKDGKDLPVEPKKQEAAAPAADAKVEFVKVADVQKRNEKDAIKRVETILESDDDATKALKTEINDNWDEIKAFYTGKGGKDDVDAIIEDIYDAHAAWKRRNGGKSKDGNGTAANLAAHRSAGGSSPKAGQQQAGRKHVLNKGSKPQDWYPKKTT